MSISLVVENVLSTSSFEKIPIWRPYIEKILCLEITILGKFYCLNL